MFWGWVLWLGIRVMDVLGLGLWIRVVGLRSLGVGLGLRGLDYKLGIMG